MLEATAKQETQAQADGLVLQVRDLTVHYQTPLGPVKAVEGISFDLHEGERLGLVGESGSGKSTTAFALMRLIKPPGQIVDGSVMYLGQELLGATPEEMRQIRFADIALIPQGAMNSLNPVMRIKEQLFDTIRAHETGTSGPELRDRVTELLASVDLPANTANLFPHELSGGMKQRVCIAMATALKPKIILADEPTSALDVVVQRQVFETLARGAGGIRRRGHTRRPRHGLDGAVRKPDKRHVRRKDSRGLSGRGPVPRPSSSLHARIGTQPAVIRQAPTSPGHSGPAAIAP